MSDKTPEVDDESFVVGLPWGPVTLPIPSTDSLVQNDVDDLDDEFQEEVLSKRELREMGEDFNPPYVFLRAYIHPEITHLFVESWCIQVWDDSSTGNHGHAETYSWDEYNPWFYEFNNEHIQRLIGLYAASNIDQLIQILQAELDAHPDEDENEAWRGPETLHTKFFEYGYLPAVNSESDLRPIWGYDTFRELYDEKRLNEIISSGAPLMKGGHQSLEQALEYIDCRPAD
jgi:hypothetical protein